MSDPYAPHAAPSDDPYGPRGAVHAGPYGTSPTTPPSVNGLAITSVVLGFLWLFWVGSILAVIFGLVALGQIRRAPATAPQDGRVAAIVGLVLGGLGVGTLLLFVVVIAAGVGAGV